MLFLSRKPEVALTNLPQGSVPLNNATLSRYLCLLSISHTPLVHIAVALRSSGTMAVLPLTPTEILAEPRLSDV